MAREHHNLGRWKFRQAQRPRRLEVPCRQAPVATDYPSPDDATALVGRKPLAHRASGHGALARRSRRLNNAPTPQKSVTMMRRRSVSNTLVGFAFRGRSQAGDLPLANADVNGWVAAQPAPKNATRAQRRFCAKRLRNPPN
jgi:hypothetical protein